MRDVGTRVSRCREGQDYGRGVAKHRVLAVMYCGGRVSGYSIDRSGMGLRGIREGVENEEGRRRYQGYEGDE